MMKVRKGSDRGTTRIGWLDSRHSFSFGDYYDPAHHHFRSLRVINEDWIAGGGGFPTHPHRDMEIITYVLKGELQHEDSMGNGSVIRPGQWQKMTAGTGILHSEFNASPSETVHLYQIWIVPNQKGLTPSYEEWDQIGRDADTGTWHRIASQDGRDGSITVHQDADLLMAAVKEGDSLSYPIRAGRGVWLQVVSGEVAVSKIPLQAGDALMVEDESSISLTGTGTVFLFDLA